ncbi:glycosyltransferase [Tenacibaculum ovolyticum]|uniref:glycosyltransferase n=1 Tax=Tenacibaculum ovolyticum TaxID=104270 RepID=UPI001F20E3BE|nr:glycosyltransferase [Tenacibaculum ovolyticum]
MKNTSQHIVFLTPGFAKSEEDSTSIPALQVYLKNLRNALPNCKMTILSFQFPYTKKKYKWHNIEVIPLNGQSKRYKKLLIWKKALLKLSKLHKKHLITTIHSFWIGECSIIGTRFSNKHNINHIVTVMGQDAKLKNLYAKYLANTNVKIVTLSQNNSNILYKNYQLTSTIIPWFLDIDIFPKIQQSDIDILGVGSLIPVKNYPDFINVISILVKTHPNLIVEIIGEGDQIPLNQLVKKNKLEDNISIIGGLSRNHVLKKMANSKLLLHTSNYESFGFVFSEALYSGMHIVSYNVGIAKPLNEWIVCSNKLELIKSCEKLLLLPNKVKKRILLNSQQQSVNDYLDLYNS